MAWRSGRREFARRVQWKGENLERREDGEATLQ
jgi:hypothetical protein